MNTASGTSTDDARWPTPVLAAPRGVREITWHLTIVAVLTLVLALKGGWLILPWVGVVAWIVRPTPRQLAKVSAAYLVVALLLAWWLSPLAPASHIAGAIWWIDHPGTSILDGLIHILIVMAAATAATGVLISFDRRRVNRRVVDHRVWDRQVRRRRQLMRRWAWGRQLPEVLP